MSLCELYTIVEYNNIESNIGVFDDFITIEKGNVLFFQLQFGTYLPVSSLLLLLKNSNTRGI